MSGLGGSRGQAKLAKQSLRPEEEPEAGYWAAKWDTSEVSMNVITLERSCEGGLAQGIGPIHASAARS